MDAQPPQKRSQMVQRPGELQRRAPSQRSRFLGVETSPVLVWQDWEPGQDFTKTLVLKNVHSKLQKLQFRPPLSKHFTTVIQQIILLSPGTSHSMPITFTPQERCEYEDSIEFQGVDGTFQVSLRAVIPRHALAVPKSVVLPVCAVQHSTKNTFLFENTSKLHTWFQWDSAAPFQLSPKHGLLKPGHKCSVTVVFRPQEALLHQQEVCCMFGDNGKEAVNRCTVLLQGQAKYPYLQLRCPPEADKVEPQSPVIQFGPVAIGCRLKKHFDIINSSPVTASFSFSSLRGGTPQLGPEFSCDVSSGELASGASLRATVTYTPVVVDTVAVDYLALTYPGSLSNTELTLTGNCIGPTITVSCPLLDFGCVQEGGEVVRKVELVNSSPGEAFFQWNLDGGGHSVFSIHPDCGTLAPNSHIRLKVVYRPTQTMAHHRRVACLVLHRDPVFLDVIGTCHSELQKPAILRPGHLNMAQLHWHRVVSQPPPDQPSAVTTVRKIKPGQQGALCPVEEESAQEVQTLERVCTPIDEYYQACSGGFPSPSSSPASFHTSPHLTVEPPELVFDLTPSSSSSPSASSSQSVAITNHTEDKLSLMWTALPDSPFSVSPPSRDLCPLKSTSFRVTYAPTQINALHGAQLECFAVYTKKISQAVQEKEPEGEERLVFPPWCVTVRVIGHSFQLGAEHFSPRCSVKPPTVVFPALGVPSHRSVVFHNPGELPITFCRHPKQASPRAASVSLTPRCGLVRPGQHQILTLITTPSEDCPQQGFSLALQLNGAKYIQELTVISSVEKLCISMEAESRLLLQPTAVGSSSKRPHRIQNLSRLPLNFEWRIPGKDRKLISVEPNSGKLQPNEKMVQTWSFSPVAQTKYQLKTFLTAWPTQTPGSTRTRFPLKVCGMGCEGSIKAESKLLDLGEMLVGSCHSVEVPLINSSACPVSFCLSVKQTLLDKEPSHDPSTETNGSSALQLETERGTIASCSTMTLRTTVRPETRTWYQWTISLQILSASGSMLSAPQQLCEVRVKGVYPTLQVVDACTGGSLSGLNKVQLWKRFSLQSLNSQLTSIPSPVELTYTTPTRHSLRRCPSVFTAATMEFNFCSAPLGSEPSTVLLLFHNTGTIPVEWTLLFPQDLRLELEYWAETGQFNSTELHQMKVQDHRLFSISPRSGTLLPGQQTAVHFQYRHEFVGLHQLPVLFKLSHGREILLNLKGITVERSRPYLHFTSNRHVFTPVAIGIFSPPRQVYELYNGGALPVHYEVDTSPLVQLQEDNFNHPVLCCLNPLGEVLPGTTATLMWVFSPMEAKTYSVDILIHIHGGVSMVLTFEGCGMDSRESGSSASLYTPDAQPPVSGVTRGPLPGQVVLLSEEMVSFGNIPVHSRSTRIIFLTNVLHTDTILYEWGLPQEDGQLVVQMCPETGRLGPDQSVICVLTLNANDCAAFYQLDLNCQVTLEAAVTQYRDSLRHWDEAIERQKHEFIITDNDLRGSRGVEEPQTAPVGHKPLIRKYKTLPPIRACSIVGGTCTRPTRAERRAQRDPTAARRRPEPPKPAVLHLRVTARSHGVLEYQTHFPDRLNTNYIYRTSLGKPCGSQTPSSTPLPDDLPPLTHGLERDIITNMITSLFMSLMEDPDFEQSVMSLASGAPEQVPYFRQLGERGGPSVSPAPYRSVSAPASTTSLNLALPRPISAPDLSSLMEQLLGKRGETPVEPPSATPEQPQSATPEQPPSAKRERILRCAEFSALCEDILTNSLMNLMGEVSLGELQLIALPRCAPLPPVSARTSEVGRERNPLIRTFSLP